MSDSRRPWTKHRTEKTPVRIGGFCRPRRPNNEDVELMLSNKYGLAHKLYILVGVISLYDFIMG
jgi:hypothetical protein